MAKERKAKKEVKFSFSGKEIVLKQEGNSIDDLRLYYSAIVNRTNTLLSDNPGWIKRFMGYVKSPDWKNTLEKVEAIECWINAYKNCIGIIEGKTELVFYFSPQGGSVSLRYRGTIIIAIDNNSVIESQGNVISAKWSRTKTSIDYLKARGMDTVPSGTFNLVDKINTIQSLFPRNSSVDNQIYGECSFESIILELFDGRYGKGSINAFYRYCKPVKRIIKKPKEIGFYQMTTPISASKVHEGLDMLVYSRGRGENSELEYDGGGIDLLLRRGKGNSNKTLTLIELKDKYERSESPELALGQLVAYATFLCNLFDIDKEHLWGREFGYQSGLKAKNLNLIIMMPEPEKGKPRKDFLDKDGGFSMIKIQTIENKEYTLFLHYCFFDRNNVSQGIETSLLPL